MNILLTSVGRRSYIARDLRQYLEEMRVCGNIIAVNSSPYSTGCIAADRFYIAPLIYDEDYIPFLLDLCEREKIDIVLPLFDIDLPVLSKNIDKFRKIGIKVIVSDEKVVEVCNDKLRMNEFLEKNGFETIRTYTDLKEASEHDFSKSEIIIKPRWGMGSMDIFIAENREELQILYKKARRDLEKSYLKYEASADLSRAILMQERILGTEFGVDVINDLNGEYVLSVVKEKIAMRAGETDIAKILIDKALEDMGRKMSERTHHIGNMDMDILVAGDKKYIIDMNARLGGGYFFTQLAGANFLRAMLYWQLGENESALKELKIRELGCFAKDIKEARIF